MTVALLLWSEECGIYYWKLCSEIICTNIRAHTIALSNGITALLQLKFFWSGTARMTVFFIQRVYFFQQYQEHSHKKHSLHSHSAPPRPHSPVSLFTILLSALSLDPVTLCLVSGSISVWCSWHHLSQWLRCHLQLYCPLSAWQWAALFGPRTALVWHAPSVNDKRERGSWAESAGLVWPIALDAWWWADRKAPLSPDSNFSDQSDKKEERICLMLRFE